ncbi:hypothetical protein PVL29_003623 [Vitis rotundifolia]|nr:hypothetical protein PVL29_003623 [Vitis rotundifolia]
MAKLRLLKIYCNDHDGLTREEYKVLLPKNFQFPHDLRYLHWQRCTLTSLPWNFYEKHLIEINLKSSNIKQLWKGNKRLEELKGIDLSNSKQLVKMPKFSSMPNLERLNLEGCTSLRELHSSIGDLKSLTYLNLGGCEQLRSFPSSMKFESLEVLYLNCCPNLKKFPEIHGNMECLKELYLNKSGIQELPSSIVHLASLEVLNLSDCSNFKKFPEIHGNMKFLRELYLERCSKFEKFPDTFTYMGHLRGLHLCESGIKELPNSIGYLESLEILDLSCCSKFEKFPEIQGNMKCLLDLFLDETAIKELPNSIGSLTSLAMLSLDHCSNFERFPEIQKNMGNLRTLHLDGTAIKGLPYSVGHLTRLNRLRLENCRNLKSLPNSICGLKSLEALNLSGCSNLEAFLEITEDMEQLEHLSLCETGISELPSSIEHLRGLKYLELINCENLVALPNSIGNLTCLTSLHVHNCPKLHKLPDNLRSLQCCLTRLDLGGCNLMEEEIPSDLWCLSSLEDLNISENHMRCIPAGITQLCKLRTLCINHCPMLEVIGELPSSLERIEAHGCPCLETETSSSLLWSSLLKHLKSPIQRRCNIIIPGSSGIPEWVSHQRMGCEVSVELPLNWYEDNNLLGFVLFFHHVPLDDDDECVRTSRFFPQCALAISHGDQSKRLDGIPFCHLCNTYWIPGLIYGRTCYGSGSTSDPALWVTYFPQIGIPSNYRSRKWNNLTAHFDNPVGNASFTCGKNASFKVKSCGVHLIYAQDQKHWPQPSRKRPANREDHSSNKKFSSFQRIKGFFNL